MPASKRSSWLRSSRVDFAPGAVGEAGGVGHQLGKIVEKAAAGLRHVRAPGNGIVGQSRRSSEYLEPAAHWMQVAAFGYGRRRIAESAGRIAEENESDDQIDWLRRSGARACLALRRWRSPTASCVAQATDKKLAGAAKTSFLKKCDADAAASCDTQAADKKLAGAAKTSFTKKCVTDATGG